MPSPQPQIFLTQTDIANHHLMSQATKTPAHLAKVPESRSSSGRRAPTCGRSAKEQAKERRRIKQVANFFDFARQVESCLKQAKGPSPKQKRKMEAIKSAAARLADGSLEWNGRNFVHFKLLRICLATGLSKYCPGAMCKQYWPLDCFPEKKKPSPFVGPRFESHCFLCKRESAARSTRPR